MLVDRGSLQPQVSQLIVVFTRSVFIRQSLVLEVRLRYVCHDSKYRLVVNTTNNETENKFSNIVAKQVPPNRAPFHGNHSFFVRRRKLVALDRFCVLFADLPFPLFDDLQATGTRFVAWISPVDVIDSGRHERFAAIHAGVGHRAENSFGHKTPCFLGGNHRCRSVAERKKEKKTNLLLH
jgi:hypothetical protein